MSPLKKIRAAKAARPCSGPDKIEPEGRSSTNERTVLEARHLLLQDLK